MEVKTITREEILNCLIEALNPLNYVYAAWQGGSAAFKRVDQWSDIDIIVDVKDDKIMDLFNVLDISLESLAKIENSYGGPQSLSPGAYQKVYKLQGTSKFMVIEICAVKHTSTEKLLSKEIHGDILVLFDKCNVTQVTPINKIEFAKTLRTRIEKVDSLFNMYQFLIEKELNRQNYIEAISFYQNFSLGLLLEMLRIKYKPYRYNFKTRYIYYDLPEGVVKKLHNYYFIKDGEELRKKHQEIIKWFSEVITDLKKTNIEELL
jgi:predicted nucleotidyltransferase